MRRLILVICAAMFAQIACAQIITSRNITFQKKERPKREFELKRGYRGFIEAGVSYNVCSFDEDNTGVGFDITTTHGYQFNKHLFLGVGTGVLGENHKYDDSKMKYMIPLFADAKVYFTKTKARPFVELRVGYDFAAGGKNIRTAYEYERSRIYDDYGNSWTEVTAHYDYAYRVRNGLHLQTGFGVEYNRFSVKASWRMRNTEYLVVTYDHITGDSWWNKHSYTDSIISLSLGVSF